MSRFMIADRETAYLLPPSVDEWLPEGHLAGFVLEVVSPLDLSELTGQYAGRGSMRGLEKVSGEWMLATLAWNVKRMNTLRMG